MKTYTMADLQDTCLHYAAFDEYFVEFDDGCRLAANARSIDWEEDDEPFWQLYGDDVSGKPQPCYVSCELGLWLNSLAMAQLGATDAIDSESQINGDADRNF